MMNGPILIRQNPTTSQIEYIGLITILTPILPHTQKPTTIQGLHI